MRGPSPAITSPAPPLHPVCAALYDLPYPTCPSLSPSPRPAPPARTPAGGAAGKAARTGAGAAKLQCTVCKTEVSATAPMKLLVEHTDSKHAKLADAVKVCFPTWVAPA